MPWNKTKVVSRGRKQGESLLHEASDSTNRMAMGKCYCQLIHSTLFHMSYLRSNSNNPSFMAFDTQRPLCKSVEFQNSNFNEIQQAKSHLSLFFFFFIVIFFILEYADANVKCIL